MWQCSSSPAPPNKIVSLHTPLSRLTWRRRGAGRQKVVDARPRRWVSFATTLERRAWYDVSSDSKFLIRNQRKLLFIDKSVFKDWRFSEAKWILKGVTGAGSDEEQENESKDFCVWADMVELTHVLIDCKNTHTHTVNGKWNKCPQDHEYFLLPSFYVK